MGKYFLGQLENLTLTKCLHLCDATELCYSVSFKNGAGCVMYKNKPQYKPMLASILDSAEPTFIFVNENKSTGWILLKRNVEIFYLGFILKI